MENVKETQMQETGANISPRVSEVNKMEVTPGFGTLAGFEMLQRMAKMFNSSSLVPESFKGDKNLGSCCIALNMAQRLHADPLQIMQSIYIVHGHPSFSSQFLIATFNASGRYTSIKYRQVGEKGKDTWGCIAYTAEKATGELIEGPTITIAMAKAEGWYGKNGSKWVTMPEQMLRYRAAAFLIRTTAPEISLGLHTTEEVEDTGEDDTYTHAINDEKEKIKEQANKKTIDVEPIKEEKESKPEEPKQPVKEEPSVPSDGPLF